MQKHLHVHVWREETRWTNPFPWGYVFTLSDWHVSPLFSIIEVIISEMLNCKSITQLREFKLHRTMGTFKDGLWTEILKITLHVFNRLTQRLRQFTSFPRDCLSSHHKIREPHTDSSENHQCTVVEQKSLQRGVYGLGFLSFFLTLLITKQKLVVFPR